MKIVFATHNKNKLEEVRKMLPNIELLSLTDINCHDDIPETSDTLKGNSILKANYVTENFGYNCFADDTGLEVNALNNEPGVYSARYAGPENNSDKNMDKLLFNLKNLEDRTAHFKTVITLNIKGEQHFFEGICEGEISKEKSGSKGFGYDPIFHPKNHKTSFAEMTMEEKGKISHRGLAIQKLITFLKEYSN
jgi:XTP/dITP diphosphohydrolase